MSLFGSVPVAFVVIVGRTHFKLMVDIWYKMQINSDSCTYARYMYLCSRINCWPTNLVCVYDRVLTVTLKNKIEHFFPSIVVLNWIKLHLCIRICFICFWTFSSFVWISDSLLLRVFYVLHVRMDKKLHNQ